MVRGADTRGRLLDAALLLLWEQSLAAASVDAICEKAGVQKGSFYHFFKSKAELVAAALDAKFQSMRPELDAIFAPTVPPVERLRRCFDLMYAHQREKFEECGRVVGCPYASVGSSCAPEDSVIQEKAKELLAIQMTYLVTTMRDGKADGSIPVKDPQAAAESVLDFMQGAMTAARIQNDLRAVKNVGRGVFALLGVKLKKQGVRA